MVNWIAIGRRAVAPAVVPVLIVLAAAALAIWPTWPPLIKVWGDMVDYAHAPWVVLGIVGWILILGSSLPPPAPRLSAVAAVLLAIELVAWLIAYRAASNIGQQLMMPLVLWTALWLACGIPVARRLALPLACLYCAIPVWELLLPTLQFMTVTVSQTLLGWLGVPVAIDGNLVTIPEGTFQIIEGCAGKRYFMIALTAAIALASLCGLTPPRAAALLSATAVLALVMNWLRVMIVIYAGHVTDMTSYLIVHEHLSLGWVMFAILIGLVCLLARWLAGPAPAPSSALPAGARSAAAVQSAASMPPLRRWIAHPGALVTLLILCLAPLGAAYARSMLRAAPAARRASLPVRAAPAAWPGPESPDTQWSPSFQGAAADLRAAYGDPGHTVEVFVATYQSEQLGAKLVSSSNTLWPTNWVVVHRDSLTNRRIPARLQAARTVETVSPDAARWIVSYLYQVDDAVTANPVIAQLLYGVRSWKGPLATRLVAVAARCHGECDTAQRDLSDFWTEVGPQLLAANP